MHCASSLGWSDLLLFSIFVNGHIAADIFMSSIPKNRQSFHFQKITKNGYLKLKIKNGYFFGKFTNTKTSMKTREKENSKLKNV